MAKRLVGIIVVSLLFSLVLAACAPTQVRHESAPSVEFLGKYEFPGTASDLDKDNTPLEDGSRTPANRLGGIGSAIAWTGNGNRYVMLPDRGPADGTTSYKPRLQIVDIAVGCQGDGKWSIEARLVETVLLTTADGGYLTGKSDAISPNLRLDPEGICVGKLGTYFVSDEYGPRIVEFDTHGRATQRNIDVPSGFLVAKPNGDPDVELRDNGHGRQPNRGMEGLTISPDGRHVYGIMQSPLIQDGALDASYKRVGRNIRILRVDLETGATKQYLYRLDDAKHGVNEILAMSDNEFLAIERDSKSGPEAKCKVIYRLDIAGATDISDLDSLPSTGNPAGVVCVRKSLLIDLLSPEYGLSGAGFPEKVEGLTLGPSLPDGRQLLIVTTDNDFIAGVPSVIYAFALARQFRVRSRFVGSGSRGNPPVYLKFLS